LALAGLPRPAKKQAGEKTGVRGTLRHGGTSIGGTDREVKGRDSLAAVLGETLGTVYLLAPLLGGAMLHGLFMRFDWLPALKVPIDGGRSWRGRRWFGHSKTWRGPVLVAAGAAVVWALQQHALHALPGFAAVELVDYASLPGLWFGALAGFVAELGELPNSFAKRRLGIGPGQTARGPLAVVFYLADQLDVVIGYWIVVGWAVPPTPPRLAVAAAVGVAIHPLLTWIGYLLRMRPTAR
jgi:hypothetical protein